ncbi:uncharacterized protein UMAG_02797 [Mycosarcoma maydis]|uniref:Uncharacterized protein n=1 Tax=Mycosarcoma maydis TaxID=5270 RepID=A0A0D1E0T4_MYCMD|nr:uncharacterized protein UMAG_02797 [Ustilago maydis 521]KIS69466.1 hypothetical protein UMAG_02797 [Ustilago maydis 521]|eukprot:XP_011389147.1 hypothetical protein UMAG_02797 [Ustilago maydis 521]
MCLDKCRVDRGSTSTSMSTPTPTPTQMPMRMDSAAKLRAGLEYKSAGNAAYVRGETSSALASYHHAVLYLCAPESRRILDVFSANSLPDRAQPVSCDVDQRVDDAQDVASQSQTQLSLVYSNMSACYLKQNKYQRAIQTADKALQCNAHNVKAIFRKANALRLDNQLYSAERFLSESILTLRANNTDAQLLHPLHAELNAVQRAIADKHALASNKWKGFLNKHPSVLHESHSASSM